MLLKLIYIYTVIYILFNMSRVENNLYLYFLKLYFELDSTGHLKMIDIDDPLESCPGNMPNERGHRPVFNLTDAGIRLLLGRKKIRSKPFIRIICIGCKRSCWDKCRFIPGDYLECLT